MTQHTRRGSRGRRKPVPSGPCPREGCTRSTVDGYEYCSYFCRVLNRELDSAQRVCEVVGAAGRTAELWASIVAAADGWSEYQQLQMEIHEAALSVGMTEEQWRAIKEGNQGQRQER
jgi:hypothetical protein